MHSQTLISMLAWVAVLCSTRVVSDILSDIQKSELAMNLNMLVRHSGWQLLGDVKIKKNKRKELVEPISEILEAVSLNREPVNESNVMDRYMEIWTVLMCKYGEIIFNYKNLLHLFIRICQVEKIPSDSFQKYYDCFDLLLIKLHTMARRFQCITDAVDLLYKLGPQPNHKFILPGMQKLTEYTLTLRQSTVSKFSERGTAEDVVDHEINAIGDYISKVYSKNISWFINDHCHVSRKTNWIVPTLADDYIHAKNRKLIPPEWTMVQYVEKEYDDYVNEIMSKWFYNLGFTYGVEGKISIGTN